MLLYQRAGRSYQKSNVDTQRSNKFIASSQRQRGLLVWRWRDYNVPWRMVLRGNLVYLSIVIKQVLMPTKTETKATVYVGKDPVATARF